MFGAILCPRPAKATAKLVFDLDVQRSTSVGLPAVEASTTSCRISNTAACTTSTFLRPPPARRIRPAGSVGAPLRSSATPLRIVG